MHTSARKSLNNWWLLSNWCHRAWFVGLPVTWLPVFDFTGLSVNQDPAHEIAGLEYLFANKKDFGGDDNARQKLGSVLI